MSILFEIILILLIILTFWLLKIKFFEPVGLIIVLNFVLPFIGYPILKCLSFNSAVDQAEFVELMTEPMATILVIYIFWILGFFMLLPKREFKSFNLNYHFSDRYFAAGMLISGVLLFFFVFFYSGINFFAAFSDPLGTRYQLMEKGGAFYLRNIALWLIWSGWFLLLLLNLQGYKISKLMLTIIFLCILFICTPLGQRYQLVFPIILLLLILLYFKRISSRMLVFGGIILVLVLPILAIYRELGKSATGFSFDEFYSGIEAIADNSQVFFSVISERFENLIWFGRFLSIKDSFDYNMLDSITGFLNLFVPAGFTGGIKAQDIEGLLTLRIVGSTDFGTFSFTAFPEWYLTMGYMGYVVFAFASGFVSRLLVMTVDGIGNNIFFLVLFADGFFMKLPFINLNSYNNISVLIYLCFAGMVWGVHQLYRR